MQKKKMAAIKLDPSAHQKFLEKKKAKSKRMEKEE